MAATANRLAEIEAAVCRCDKCEQECREGLVGIGVDDVEWLIEEVRRLRHDRDVQIRGRQQHDIAVFGYIRESKRLRAIVNSREAQ
jgi:hypothetical protein